MTSSESKYGVITAPENAVPASRRMPHRQHVLLDPLVVVLGMTEARGPTVSVTFATEQPHMVGIAKLRHRLRQRVEHRLQVEGGAADHLEHVGGGGLLLQRLSSLPPCLGKLPPCLVSVTLRFRKLAGPGVQLLLQSFD